ncbi:MULTISPECIES: hypothetical protein [unclassified Bacteroides]|uniref:hypothetical protein n=1 Tax=unclassified Bacteroides TaxID=2646097 RepID=UPI000E862199|nr:MULTISPECIES: hypothetical protein [unclassified Bacteroides]RGN50025.1 hypothetical protein DXB63_05815 [Bacteroides sp. OM05-12]RHR75165.1 hypothetical protein DWW69_11075 [Bacteroides sp. AF16-49]DAU20749.1 MAG TPA: hypothetical protein [Caudoviricetes sp.]
MKQLIIIIFVMSGICLSSCRSVQYIPVETIKTNTEYRDRLQRDSIHIKDSVLMFVKGDTVFRDRWHTEYRDKLIRDTINITDTIKTEVPYPVEKKLSKWQSFKMDVGGWAFGIIIAFILIVACNFVRKLKNK